MRKIVMQRYDTKEPVIVEYDETAPCLICGNPVIAASFGGLDICPSCDCGRFRDGRKISEDPQGMIYLHKQFASVKYKIIPHVPSFQQYDDVAVALAAHGVDMSLWKRLQKRLANQREDDEEFIKKRFEGEQIPETVQA